MSIDCILLQLGPLNNIRLLPSSSIVCIIISDFHYDKWWKSSCVVLQMTKKESYIIFLWIVDLVV